MPSRQFHTKSRHGCANCKRRKIRCGEQRPECANCQRLGGECSFLETDLQGGLTVVQGVDAGPSSAQTAPEPLAPRAMYELDRLSEDLSHFDDELIMKYSSSTSLTVTDRPDVIPTWQLTMPALALATPYLRHGLLALAAMHLHYQAPAEMRPLYSRLASLHQDEALPMYISELASITEETCHTLLAFSLLLPPLRFSFLISSTEPLAPMTFIDQLISIFEFLIGSTVISAQTNSWLRQGPMAPIFTLRTLESIIPDLVDDPRQALTSLMNFISEEVEEEETINIGSHAPTYKRSIQMLSNAFPSTSDVKRYYLDATIGWPYFVGPDFIQLLKTHDSLALVILAYYGAALHDFGYFWWLDGWGTKLVNAVALAIDNPLHNSLLKWPLAKVSAATGPRF